MISSPNGSEWIKGEGIIPGSKHDQSSYRSELGGQLGIASIVSNIIIPDNISPNLIMTCGGLSTLEQTSATKKDLKVKGKHFNLISITCDHLENSIFPEMLVFCLNCLGFHRHVLV